MKKKSIIAAAAAALLMLTGCGAVDDSSETKNSSSPDSSVISSEADASAEEAAYEVPEKIKEAAQAYDPEGEERLFELMKEEYYGDYMLSTVTAVNGMNSSNISNIKGNEMALVSVNQGVQTRAFYFEDKSFYSISDTEKTFEKYHDYKYDIRNSDTLFGATADFVSAKINDEGNIEEVYALDTSVVRADGTLTYIYSQSTGALLNYRITLGKAEVSYSVNGLSASDPGAFELPDLSDYKENATYQTPIAEKSDEKEA